MTQKCTLKNALLIFSSRNEKLHSVIDDAIAFFRLWKLPMDCDPTDNNVSCRLMIPPHKMKPGQDTQFRSRPSVLTMDEKHLYNKMPQTTESIDGWAILDNPDPNGLPWIALFQVRHCVFVPNGATSHTLKFQNKSS